MAREQGDAFKRLHTKADGVRSEWEYPFCAGASGLVPPPRSPLLHAEQGGSQACLQADCSPTAPAG